MTYTSRILIVDDEAAIRTTLGALLERRGYVVTVASTGHDALRWIQRRRFDLVVLDSMLPDALGANVAAQARMYQPQLGLIILSCHTSTESQLDGALPNDAVWLPKTVDPQQVLSQIANILARQQEQSFAAVLQGFAIVPRQRSRRVPVPSNV